MCSRYELSAKPREVMERFDLDAPPPLPNRPEMRPTDTGLVIDCIGRSLLLTWGLIAPWDGRSLINARAETLHEKPTFRPLLANRCVIPANAWFEWRTVGRDKLKNRYEPKDGGILGLAGIHDGEHFTVITCPAAPELEHIHRRMPAVLHGEAEARWLDGRYTFSEVNTLLHPFPADELSVTEEIPEGFQADLFG